MSKHFLMIGASREIHSKVKELGYRQSALIDIRSLKGRRDLSIYDRLVALPTTNVDEWIEAARGIQLFDPIDAIGGFSEGAQHLAVEIADALDLPFHSADTIRWTKQKDDLREKLRAAGLDETSSVLVESPGEIERFASANGYPVILKPVDGRASIGVSIIRSRSDIEGAVARFRECSPEYRMLVEQFLVGDEYSVEAFSEKGCHRIVCVTQKFKDPVTFVETGHCLPAPISADEKTAICTFVQQVLTALQFQNGPSHTEIIVTARGPRIVETHARLGGDSIVDLIKEAFGIDLDELWLRQCAGEAVLDLIPDRSKCFASIAFVTPSAQGLLTAVENIRLAEAKDGVLQVTLLQSEGSYLSGAQDSFGRAASAIAKATDAATAVARARQAAQLLKFTVVCQG